MQISLDTLCVVALFVSVSPSHGKARQEAQNADNFKYRTKVSNAGLKHDPTKSTYNMK